ncbi:MAG: methionine--tRNA ligase [Proteobacteria bacterium]|nr:methionine--tRNA ligase [Pseudomonadota bacterium]
MKKPDIYITTPLYYVNSHPHIGHTFTTVVADIVKRYHKLFGRQVYLLTGTDEHGEKIAMAAQNAGVDVKKFVDDNSKRFKEVWDLMGLEYDDFIRTTEERHKKVVRYLLQKLHDTGDIYFASYEGHYCIGCERFITASELVDGKCPDHGTVPKLVKEENYFFKMSKYVDTFKKEIEKKPDIIRPEWYRNEVLGYLKEKIEDLCISRPKDRVSWGIELPFDNRFVTYVWFDALLNYISAIGYPDNPEFKDYWNVSEHFIAKDILRTHTIYWGTMLLASGLPLYKHLNVHGYWNMSGMKMSKSLGNVIEPTAFKQKYGDQGLRFFFLREMHWGEDSDFTMERYIGRYNTDLANNYGNLISRTMGMMEKYYPNDEKIEITKDLLSKHPLKDALENVIKSYKNDFYKYEFHKTLELMWALFDDTNKHIAESKPWEIAKAGDKAALCKTLAPVLEIIRITTYMLTPIMPLVCTQILNELGFEGAVNVKFDDFTKWGYSKTFNVKYKNKKFFERIEQ